MGFESWYLRQHLSKRKTLSIGLVVVILSVTLISASPTLAYFHTAEREANTASAQSSLVRVFFADSKANFSDLRGINGVQEVIPMAVDVVTITVGSKNSTNTVLFVSASDAPSMFNLFGFETPNELPSSNWLYFGYTAGSDLGITQGRLTNVSVNSIGEMTATTSSTTFSDSDFSIVGDIQAYWAGSHSLGTGTYNALFVRTVNSTVADYVARRIMNAHPDWQVEIPSARTSYLLTTASSGQLILSLSLSVVSWAFGMSVFVAYVVRDVSARSKELVILGALGAPRVKLVRCVSYYLLILTSVGSVIGLFLTLDVIMPIIEVQSFGYSLIESSSTVLNTILVVLAPVLILDVVIVVVLQFRLSRLDMMSFLRSEV